MWHPPSRELCSGAHCQKAEADGIEEPCALPHGISTLVKKNPRCDVMRQLGAPDGIQTSFSANWSRYQGGIRRALQPKSPVLHHKSEQVLRSAYSTLHTFPSSEPVRMSGARQIGCLIAWSRAVLDPALRSLYSKESGTRSCNAGPRIVRCVFWSLFKEARRRLGNSYRQINILARICLLGGFS
jgi:hypothetical protein